MQQYPMCLNISHLRLSVQLTEEIVIYVRRCTDESEFATQRWAVKHVFDLFVRTCTPTYTLNFDYLITYDQVSLACFSHLAPSHKNHQSLECVNDRKRRGR